MGLAPATSRPVTHWLDFTAPTLPALRWWPCTATGLPPHEQPCGATPASLWRRWCPNGHSDRVRLCGTHAALVTLGCCRCRPCAERGAGFVPASIAPVDLVLLGYVGTGQDQPGT
jgi:hypothetical protein